MNRAQVDKSLAMWAGQLLYPGVGKYGQPGKDPRVRSTGQAYGGDLRAKLRALVRRTPEVMVRVSGGGRGMRPIRAHLLYISRCGELEIEDERGEKSLGRDALEGLAEEWRLAGAEIPATSHRREAFHLMLSMSPGTDAGAILWAAREFARVEFAQHKFAGPARTRVRSSVQVCACAPHRARTGLARGASKTWKGGSCPVAPGICRPAYRARDCSVRDATPDARRTATSEDALGSSRARTCAQGLGIASERARRRNGSKCAQRVAPSRGHTIALRGTRGPDSSS